MLLLLINSNSAILCIYFPFPFPLLYCCLFAVEPQLTCPSGANPSLSGHPDFISRLHLNHHYNHCYYCHHHDYTSRVSLSRSSQNPVLHPAPSSVHSQVLPHIVSLFFVLCGPFADACATRLIPRYTSLSHTQLRALYPFLSLLVLLFPVLLRMPFSSSVLLLSPPLLHWDSPSSIPATAIAAATSRRHGFPRLPPRSGG